MHSSWKISCGVDDGVDSLVTMLGLATDDCCTESGGMVVDVVGFWIGALVVVDSNVVVGGPLVVGQQCEKSDWPWSARWVDV